MTVAAWSVAEIGESVRASQLIVPLERVSTFSPEDPLAPVQQLLKARQFDHAPVMVEGRPVGLIGVDQEGGDLVGDAMLPLTAGFLVSGDTTFGDLLSELQHQPLLFVLVGRRIIGIVTPSDLGGIGGRTHFYVRIARLEMALSTYLRDQFESQDQAIPLLDPRQQKAFENTKRRLTRKDAYIDDLACLDLLDLVTIAQNHQPFALSAEAHHVDWERLQEGLSNFRNDVMHPSRSFALATKRGLPVLGAFDRQLELLVAAVDTAMGAGRSVATQ